MAPALVDPSPLATAILEPIDLLFTDIIMPGSIIWRELSIGIALPNNPTGLVGEPT